MPIGTPRVGQVIRYSFLWSDGKERERPAVVVLAARRSENGKYRVAVMPVTHTPHTDLAAAVEIPPRLKAHLGLDDERSWVVIDEINEFEWPGYDLRKVPGGGRWEYVQIPPKFYDALITRFRMLRQAKHLIATSRDQ